jgi:hypothetical protein
MDKGKFEEAKRILERIEHFKRLRDAIRQAKERIEKNRNLPAIRNEGVELLSNLIRQVFEEKDSEFVFDIFISTVEKTCFDAIAELNEQFKSL